MTADEQASVNQIEQDRKRREDELLLILLLLFGSASRRAVMAVRMGHDPMYAARNVILGDPALDLPGMAPAVANLLAITHADGIRRTQLIMRRAVPGITIPPTPQSPAPDLMPIYRAKADSMADTMSQTLADKITAAIANSRVGGLGTRKTAIELRKSLDDAGYGRDNPYLLETAAEAAIVSTHAAGMADAAQGMDEVWGFRFVAVLDKGTTVICRTCNGVRLPKSHPWFLSHTPSLHFGCRSGLLPIPVGSPNAVATTFPDIEPAPGFGHPWFGFSMAS